MTRACVWCKKEIKVNLCLTDLFSFNRLNERSSCSDCMAQFKKIDDSLKCSGCARPMEMSKRCNDCEHWQQIYPDVEFNHRAIFSYNDFGKEWIERFKFLGDVQMAAMIAPEIKKELKKYRKTYVIVPIPGSRKSLTERGFNQVEVLLEAADQSYINLLINEGSSEKQSSKNRSQRMNMNQPFRIKDQKLQFVRGKNILLVDDVYTTGRTLFHARDRLRKAGAKKIDTFSIFR